MRTKINYMEKIYFKKHLEIYTNKQICKRLNCYREFNKHLEHKKFIAKSLNSKF